MCDVVSMLITPIVSNLDKATITTVIRGAITNALACLKCRDIITNPPKKGD